MGLFEHFPYTNLHTLNLDWILRKFKAFESTVAELTEKVDNITDVSDDVERIDATVTELQDDFSDMQQDVSGLKTDVSELKTDVSDLKTDVEGLQTAVEGIHGVPAGGAAGQVLAKASAEDYALTWVNQSGGGGGDGYNMPKSAVFKFPSAITSGKTFSLDVSNLVEDLVQGKLIEIIIPAFAEDLIYHVYPLRAMLYLEANASQAGNYTLKGIRRLSTPNEAGVTEIDIGTIQWDGSLSSPWKFTPYISVSNSLASEPFWLAIVILNTTDDGMSERRATEIT